MKSKEQLLKWAIIYKLVLEWIDSIIKMLCNWLTWLTFWQWVWHHNNPIKVWAFVLDPLTHFFEVASSYIFS